MEPTRKTGRYFGSSAWAVLIALAAVAVFLGYSSGGFQRRPQVGGAGEPILLVTDVQWDGASENTILRMMLTNGTSKAWEISVRRPKPGGVLIPDLFQFDLTGNGGAPRPLSQPAGQGVPLEQFRLLAGQSVALEFSAPLDASVKRVGVLVDDGTAADRLRRTANRLMRRFGIPIRLNTRVPLHLVHAAIPENPLMPFLLK